MRNLKRALSLTLASVMLLGMMVVGASAAGYPDVSEEDNIEAIEVLQAVKVMVGDENGNFGPEQPVNRSQMAVVMALLLDLDYDYYQGTCPFWDVPSWAEPYVAACYANGIVSGYNAYEYGAADPVTAVQAASMMMRALGYFQFASDYKDGFELSTVKQASKILLFEGVNANATDALTRNQVAKLALNALQTPIVEAKDNTINISSTSGDANVTVTGGQVDYVVTASRQPYASSIGKTEYSGEGLNQIDGYVIELGEKLYNGSLKLNDYDIDDFGRPARKWEYNNKEIGTYAKKEILVEEYVGGVTGKNLYDLLSKSTIDRYELLVTIDGVSDKTIVGADAKNKSGYLVFDATDLNKDNNEKVGGTGTGVLTQVYVDDGNTVLGIKPQIYVAVINTYLAKAERDYDEKKDELAITVYGAKKNSTTDSLFVKNAKADDGVDQSVAGVKVAAEDVPAVASVQKDDFLLVNVAGSEVKTVGAPEVLSAVNITAFKKGSNVTVDGTKYEYTTTAEYKNGDLDKYTGNDGTINLKDITYNVYLDVYGNLIGVEEVDAVKNYVFITGVDRNGSNIINKTADARGLFLDGTSAVISFKTDKKSGADLINESNLALINTWCTYTVDSDGVYTLTKVPDAAVLNDAGDNSKNIPSVTNGDLAQYHQTFGADTDINSKNSTLIGNPVAGKDYRTVYGDKDTVYLTAKLDVLSGNGIIKDTDSIVVGAEKADLKVWTDSKTKYPNNGTKINGTDYSNGVYTLYDKDAAVIAAVVVGEDNGSAKNIVYVHSSGLEEEILNSSSSTKASGSGDWTWTRKVIKDGEEVLLTEIGDESSYLEQMEQYKPYQIKLNANGTVINAYTLPGVDYKPNNLEEANMKAAPDSSVPTDFKDVEVVTDYTKLGLARENGKDSLVFASDTINSKLRMNNTSSLYVAHDMDTGLLVNDNTRVVLIEYVKNSKETYIADEGNGGAKVKSIVDGINAKYEDRTSYPYQVTAIMSKGVATSVIIWDQNNDYLDGVNSGSNDKTVDEFIIGNIIVNVPKAWNVSDVNAAMISGQIFVSFKTAGINSITAVGAVSSKGFTLETAGTTNFSNDTITHKSTSSAYSANESYTVTFSASSVSYDVTWKGTTAATGSTTTLSDSGAAVALKMEAASLAAYNDKVSFTFKVEGIDLDTAVANTDTEVSFNKDTGVGTVTALDKTSLTGAAYNLLTSAKATGPVTVTISDIKDASTKTTIRFELDANSAKFAELTGNVDNTLEPDDTNSGIDPNTFNSSGMKVVLKDGANIGDLADLKALFYVGEKEVSNTAGTATAITTVTGAFASTTLKDLGKTEAGEELVVTVKLTPTKYTLAANRFDVVSNGDKAVLVKPVVFTQDTDGAYKNDALAGAITGLAENSSFLISVNGSNYLAKTGASGNVLDLTAKDFTVDEAILAGATKDSPITIRILDAVKITGVPDAANKATAAVIGTGTTTTAKYQTYASVNTENFVYTTTGNTWVVEKGATMTITVEFADANGLTGNETDTVTIDPGKDGLSGTNVLTPASGELVFGVDGAKDGNTATIKLNEDDAVTLKGSTTHQ